MGGINRRYRPDLSEHFILVHPKKQIGIVNFNADKTKVRLASYSFDLDGDMQIGQIRWTDILDLPKGKGIFRRSCGRAYLHDFVKAPVNPYA